MWTPWASLKDWSRKNHEHAVENARLAAVACSRARVERIEVELYVAELAAVRERRAATA
ncbi:MAG TPA: hypothetical protein VF728_06745 [Nocardioides sp.]|nr:hypothetical protein [Nocardioides sp.]